MNDEYIYSHILRRTCLHKHVVEDERDKNMELMGSRGRRCKQVL